MSEKISHNIKFSQKAEMNQSISKDERRQRAAFHRKISEMKTKEQNVMACEKCFMIFSDVILHRMHVAMHAPTITPSLGNWKCSMCLREFADRVEFYAHTVKYSHSLYPAGYFIPKNLIIRSGLPDLASLVKPSKILEEITKNLEKKE